MSFDHAQARSEGWDLFVVSGRLSLQRIDCPFDYEPPLGYRDPKFNSDIDAIIFVAARAGSKSDYHREALSLIGKATTRANEADIDRPIWERQEVRHIEIIKNRAARAAQATTYEHDRIVGAVRKAVKGSPPKVIGGQDQQAQDAFRQGWVAAMDKVYHECLG